MSVGGSGFGCLMKQRSLDSQETSGLDRLDTNLLLREDKPGVDYNMRASHDFELAYAKEYQAFQSSPGTRALKQCPNGDHMLPLNKLFQIALSTMPLEARLALSTRSTLY